MRLDGQVAIVTGAGSGTGANQGIGKAFALSVDAGQVIGW